MTGLYLTETQNEIMAFLKQELSQFPYYEGPMTEDEQFWRDQDAEMQPTMIIWFGKLRSRGYGKAVAGPRHDDYFTYMDVVCAGSFYPPVREALNLVTDYLTGFKPAHGTHLIPAGGTSDNLTRSYSVRPMTYLDSQRFEYGVNTQPGPPPTRPDPPIPPDPDPEPEPDPEEP